MVLDSSKGLASDRVYGLLDAPEGIWVGTDLGKLVLVVRQT